MGADFDRELGHGACFHQRGADRVAHEIVHHALLPKADFGFRRVHVDIHFAAGQIEKQQHHREDGGRQNVAISLDDGVLDEAVADQASVDEDVDRVAIQFLDFGFRDKAVYPEFAERWSGFIAVTWFLPAAQLCFSTSLRRQGGGCGRPMRSSGCTAAMGISWSRTSFAENLVHPLAVTRDRRRHQHGVGGRVQFEMLVGMGQRVVRDQRCDVRKLGGLGFQEFLARRDIEEEIADGNAGSGRQAGFFHLEDLAAVDFDHRA